MELEAVIGLEIHVQIATKSKMFCGCDNDSFDKEPNINVCPVCMGFPGQLPVLNEEAVHKGLKAALALNCVIPSSCKFDRKNYFYPDNPKGFQISQYDEPLSKDGFVEIVESDDGGKVMKIGITRLHLEDDAGKLTHVQSGSLVDFNRAGTPLMEIVSEPDMHSSLQADLFAREVQKIVRYVYSSEADMEKGMMRFDASVSLRPVGEKKLYPRAEIKNLNSFRALKSAIDFEIGRQSRLWEEGKTLTAPITVGWDDDKKETFFMRDKEESDDYRYFPEPDIPPLTFDDAYIAELRANLPQLPAFKRKKYVEEFDLNPDDARLLSDDPVLAQYFEAVVEECGDGKKAASFVTTILMKRLNEDLIDVDKQKVSAAHLGQLIKLINEGAISGNQAKGEIFSEMYETGKSPAKIVAEKGLQQVSDESAIEAVCGQVIEANASAVEDFKNGKDKALGFLIGMVMKEMKGQGNPAVIDKIMRKLL